MQQIMIEGYVVDLDDRGFMVEPDDWNEQIAAALGRTAGLDPFTEHHWAVIRCIRDYFEEFRSPPMLRLICKRTGTDRARLAELFLTSCRDCICRFAGLPRPVG